MEPIDRVRAKGTEKTLTRESLSGMEQKSHIKERVQFGDMLVADMGNLRKEG